MAEKDNLPQDELRNGDDKIDWIVPPGLRPVVEDFVKLCDQMYSPAVEKKKPLMICGDTGVGKSLFVRIFERKYKDFYKLNDKKIVRLNFAALEKDLIASELFGHIEGAFTGAIRKKKGLIEKADGGLLILEEIGELSEENQARLLTFIENGYYYPVGSEEEKRADVQIIGTTHQPKNHFRPDFWSRFFQFYIPALYERRIDVLYYLFYMHKNILLSLTQNELLSILAYHWPGNVREVDNIGFLLKWRDWFREHKRLEDERSRKRELPLMAVKSAVSFLNFPNKYTSLFFGDDAILEQFLDYTNWNRDDELIRDIDFDLLEFFLEKIGFTISSAELYAFPPNINIGIIENEELGIKFFNECDHFEKYSNSFNAFCKMFENREYDCEPKDECFANNLLVFKCGDSPKKSWYSDARSDSDDFIEKVSEDELAIVPNGDYESLENELGELQKAIYEFRTNTKIEEDLFDYLEKKRDSEEKVFVPENENEEVIDLSSITDKDLEDLRYEVYKKRLEKTHWNKAEAARLLGLKERTFLNRLKKYPDLNKPKK